MRVITRRAAGLEQPAWDRGAAEEVTRLFDALAPEWHTRESDDRTSIVSDALTRGLDPLRHPAPEPGSAGAARQAGPTVALELGSGLGTYSQLVADRCDVALAVDLSLEMQHRAHRSDSLRMIADGSGLPVRDSVLACAVLVNCFLFPDELTRTIAPGGVVLWVNTSGESTPIHLSTQDVIDALPFEVEGVEARAGVGTWCALRRTN